MEAGRQSENNYCDSVMFLPELASTPLCSAARILLDVELYVGLSVIINSNGTLCARISNISMVVMLDSYVM